jgi:hypothetical protein
MILRHHRNVFPASLKIKILFVMIYIYFFSGVSIGAGSELLVTPRISLSEGYSDNVFGAQYNKKSDFITQVLPGVIINYNAPLWNFSVDYYADFIHYDNNVHNDETTHYLNTSGKVRIIDNFMFLDVSDMYQRIPLDVKRDTTWQSLFLDQTDTNIFHASPYIDFRAFKRAKIKMAYIYNNIHYGYIPAINKQDNGFEISPYYELTPKCTLSTNFIYTHTDTNVNINYNRSIYSIGFDYEYLSRSFFSLEAGYEYFSLNSNISTGFPYLNLKISYQYRRFVVSLLVGSTFNTDPFLAASEQRGVTGRLDMEFDRSTMSLYSTYNEYIDNIVNEVYSKSLEIGWNLKYELTPKTIAISNIIVDRYYNVNYNHMLPNIYYEYYLFGYSTAGERPYHSIFNIEVSHELSSDLSVGLSYSFISDSNGIFSLSDAINTNVVTLSITKTFGTISLLRK